MLTCAGESGECLTELANALGVDGLITGTVGKLDAGYLVNVKIVASGDGHAMAAASGRFKTDSQVVDWLTSLAPEMAVTLRTGKAGGPVEVAVGEHAPSTVRSTAWVPLVAGEVVALTGVGLLIGANIVAGTVRTGGPALASSLDPTLQSGRLYEKLGWVGVGLGSASLLAGVLMYALGGDAPKVALLVSPRGGFLSVEVAFR